MTTGMSLTEVAAQWKMSPRTLHRWTQDYPEFGEAKELAVSYSEAWWERYGRLGTFGLLPGGAKMNATSYIYTMKCRFKGQWLEDGTTNRLEITNKHTNMSDKELNRLIEAKLNHNTINITPEQLKIEQLARLTPSECIINSIAEEQLTQGLKDAKEGKIVYKGSFIAENK